MAIKTLKKNIFSYYPDELLELLDFEKTYTSNQFLDWIYRKQIINLDQITNISKEDIQKIDKHFFLTSLKIIRVTEASKSETKKFLLQTADNYFIEAVLIANPDNSFTLCLSSQVGCSYDCSFCATGKMRYRRNLYVHEIVEQYLLLNHESKGRTKNLVFMGMGEPLINIKNVKKAINILTSKNALGLSPKRISLSTIGLIPGIREMADYRKNVNLLISIHSADQVKRDKIMPNMKNQPLSKLKKVIKEYNSKKKNKVFIEYIMLKDFNDSLEDADKLRYFLNGLKVKVNIIAYNSVPGIALEASNAETIQAFKIHLLKKKVIVTQRFKKGDDIQAACGQLAFGT